MFRKSEIFEAQKCASFMGLMKTNALVERLKNRSVLPVSMVSKKEILFPHPEIRQTQSELIEAVVSCLKKRQNLIAHAPTGLGKTAATIPATLSFAIANNLTVFFLTSRHTQHRLAIETIAMIKKRHKKNIVAADIIGKKWMCIQPAVEVLFSGEFSDYCKKLREDKKCDFYLNVKKESKLTKKAERFLDSLKQQSPLSTEALVRICKKEKMCPYEMVILLSRESQIIVADYNHIFDPSIRNAFLLKTNKKLEESIVIVDEAHNLAKRVRETLTTRLTSVMLKRALKEAEKDNFLEQKEIIRNLNRIFEGLSDDMGGHKTEKFVNKEDLLGDEEYSEIIESLESAGDEIRKKQRQSYLSSIAYFLEHWKEDWEGFARILAVRQSEKNSILELSYRCLDPSPVTKEVNQTAYSVMIMSGTLTPTFMYKDILGFEEAVEKEFENPFPTSNRLNLIIPETTTKYTRRNSAEYKNIAAKIIELSEHIPGNIIVFFPSYFLRNNVFMFLDGKTSKRLLLEKRNLTKEEKNGLLEEFKKEKKNGAVLLAVASGNFGEGVDLPGDFLRAVIVVGLPLERPSLEIKKLIDYYDRKFGKGWDYAYLYPAIIRVLQNAGRCIRSETDKGVIIFLDERFAWENYYRCFPPDYDVKITKLYQKKIKEFFSREPL